jgi:hypothetical protein
LPYERSNQEVHTQTIRAATEQKETSPFSGMVLKEDTPLLLKGLLDMGSTCKLNKGHFQTARFGRSLFFPVWSSSSAPQNSFAKEKTSKKENSAL